MIASILDSSIQFTLKTKSNANSSTSQLKSVWHFDTHKHLPTPNGMCHPRFHWQFGGHGLKDIVNQIKGILVTESPRLFSPPMDPILAIDFLLSHFNGPDWNLLRQNEPRYRRIVKEAQKRLWHPYFNKIVNHFESDGVQPFNTMLPNLL